MTSTRRWPLPLETRADKAGRETDKIHAKMRHYAPDVLAIAGAVVTVDHSGAMVIYRGLVKPEDRKEANRTIKASSQSPVTTDGDDAEKGGAALSESLCRKLTAHRTKALQVLVANNAHVALACVVHALAQQVVIEHSYRTESALSIRASGCDGALGQVADDMEGSKADKELQSRLNNWRERIPGDADKLLPWLTGQDANTLLDLLALCAALSINTVTASAQEHPGDAIAKAVGLDMARLVDSHRNELPPTGAQGANRGGGDRGGVGRGGGRAGQAQEGRGGGQGREPARRHAVAPQGPAHTLIELAASGLGRGCLS